MFGYGKSKENDEKLQQVKSLIDNYRKCIHNGFLPLLEVNNGVPVLLKIESVPLYEVKTSRAYMSTRLGRGRIGTSKAFEGWKHTDSGRLIVTTNGISFYGNKTTINFQRAKVLNIESVIGQRKNEINGVKVHVSNRKNPVIFGVNDYVKEVMLFALSTASNWQVTMYESRPHLIDSNKYPSGKLE